MNYDIINENVTNDTDAEYHTFILVMNGNWADEDKNKGIEALNLSAMDFAESSDKCFNIYTCDNNPMLKIVRLSL